MLLQFHSVLVLASVFFFSPPKTIAEFDLGAVNYEVKSPKCHELSLAAPPHDRISFNFRCEQEAQEWATVLMSSLREAHRGQSTFRQKHALLLDNSLSKMVESTDISYWRDHMSLEQLNWSQLIQFICPVADLVCANWPWCMNLFNLFIWTKELFTALVDASSIVTTVTKLHIFDPEGISKDWSVHTRSWMIPTGNKLVFILY